MTVVRFEGTNEQAVSELATRAAAVVTRGSSSWPDLVLRGPAPSPIAKLRSRYRYQLQLRDSDPDAPRQAAAALRSALASEARKARVHVLIDVDPFDMM
jgi:primosomal protein N' (replication factor Y)